jgi:hypothetical protein
MSRVASTGRVVTCHCGAVYERTETRLIFWVMDDFCCQECGEILESWNGSRIPVYALIQCYDGSVAAERAARMSAGDVARSTA